MRAPRWTSSVPWLLILAFLAACPANPSETVPALATGDQPMPETPCRSAAADGECMEVGSDTLGLHARDDISDVQVFDDRVEITARAGEGERLASVVRSGRILAGGPKFGRKMFLRKATSISRDGDTLVIDTEPAKLDEAIRNARIRQRWSLDFDAAGMPRAQRMGVLRPGRTADGLSFSGVDADCGFDFIGQAGGSNYAALRTCELEFGPTVDFELEIEDFELKRFKFTVGIEFLFAVDVLARSSTARVNDDSWSVESSVYPTGGGARTLTELKFWAGPIPIRIDLDLQIFAGLFARFEEAGELGFDYEFSANPEVGVEYSSRNGWTTIAEANPSSTLQDPNLGVESDATLKAWLRPEFSALLYGAAGPQVWARPWMKLGVRESCEVLERAGNIRQTADWDLTWGVDAGASVTLEVRDREVFDRDFGEFDIVSSRTLREGDETLVVEPGDCCGTSDCSNACIENSVCEDNYCTRGRTVSDCCLSDADCTGGDNLCVVHSCRNNTCQADASSCGCEVDADCSDGNPCTDDVCRAGVCQITKVDNCVRCRSDEACNDQNRCTQDACNAAGVCEYRIRTERTGCCESNADCRDETTCTQTSCGTDYHCAVLVRVAEDGCCEESSDCTQDDSCVSTWCESNECESLRFNACAAAGTELVSIPGD